MRYSTLAQCPHLKEEVFSLVEREFGYDPNHSFQEDFLPLVHESNWENCHLVIVGDAVVAHAAIRKETLAYRHIQTPIALVGGIAVASSFRGRGIFKELFQRFINIYENSISFFLLWSKETALYEKFHFFEFGIVYENDLGGGTFAYQRVEDISPYTKDLKVLYDKNHQHTLTIRRGSEKWKIIEQMKSLDFYLLLKEGKVHAYYVKNKGQDLQGIVHEFSNSRGIREKRVWSPTPIGKVQSTFFTGHFRVGNPQLLSLFIEKLSGIIITDWQKGRVSFSLEKKRFQLPEKDFILTLWGTSESFFVPPIAIGGIDSV